MVGVATWDVVVCGSLHLDIVVDAPRLPRLDETAVGSTWKKVCGGKGGNQAVQAVRAGARTAMIGRVGRDDFGDMLRANLTRESVDTAAIGWDETQGSGMSVAIVEAQGEYGAVIVSGANLSLSGAAAMDQWQALGGARVLVLQNEIPHATNFAMARLAREAGAEVVFNAAPSRAEARDLVALVDVLVVNRVEAADLSGLPVHDRASAEQAATVLAQQARAVIVTLGGDGLVMVERGATPAFIPAVPVRVTSAHGAGDCFVGAVAAELARGTALPLACATANRRAAAHVSRIT